MKIKAHKLLALIIAIMLCVTFGTVLSMYAKPMEDVSLNLSLVPEGEDPDPADFDDKGWIVYTQEKSKKTELVSDNMGGYTGIELGQTFYFSRVMTEELDSPTLQINVAEQTIAVFLDDTLIYTDCPKLDNRIGYLTLPMNDWYRDEPIIISLPRDYRGKTLTIAQAMPEFYDATTVMALPCNVMLYCGYSYESGLIAESFTTSLEATLAFAFGLTFLIIFISNRKIGTLCIALMSFLWMTSLLFKTTFYTSYFGAISYDIPGICLLLSALTLLIFLTTKAEKFKKVIWCVVGVYSVSLADYGIRSYHYIHADETPPLFPRSLLPEWIVCIALIAILILGIIFWRKESCFYRFFAPLTLVAVVVQWIFLFSTNPKTFPIVTSSLQSGQATYIYTRLLPAVMACAIICAIVEAVQSYIEKKTENRLLKEHHKLALKSYNNLRNHHEEVMMLRHDMRKHFYALREISNEKKVTAYLDEIIGQNEKIRPVVQSGNEMIDIILNGKLGVAIDSGVKVELIKTKAPEKLSLSNADLCSLLMNIMDNAITASNNADVENPFIRIDMHIKNDYFAFRCENSANTNKQIQKSKSELTQKHGLGLKIIKGITERYDGLVSTECGQNTYKISVIFPLH